MRSTFLQILLIFSSSEGYQLQFSIPRAYLRTWYGTVLTNTAVLCMRVRIVCLPVRGAPGECCYNTLLCCDYFSSSSVVSRAFSALCVYSTFRNHPHPLRYLCAKFRFFHDLHCWASPWRSIAYSLTHAYLMPREQKRLRFRKTDTRTDADGNSTLRRRNGWSTVYWNE